MSTTQFNTVPIKHHHLEKFNFIHSFSSLYIWLCTWESFLVVVIGVGVVVMNMIIAVMLFIVAVVVVIVGSTRDWRIN